MSEAKENPKASKRSKRKAPMEPLGWDEIVSQPGMGGYLSFLNGPVPLPHLQRRGDTETPRRGDDTTAGVDLGTEETKGRGGESATGGGASAEGGTRAGVDLGTEGAKGRGGESAAGGGAGAKGDTRTGVDLATESARGRGGEPATGGGASAATDTRAGVDLATVPARGRGGESATGADSITGVDLATEEVRHRAPTGVSAQQAGVPAPRVRIRRCFGAQDGHSLGEEVLYQALWKAAAPEAGGDARTIVIGWRGMSQICRMTPKNCKINTQRLIRKLALEILSPYNTPESIGTTYRVHSAESIVRRRRAAGLEWVVRSRGVEFVNPATGTVMPMCAVTC